MKEQVILVDENDRDVGVAEKMEVHKKGLLHRAFSVVIFNKKGEMLLQKRHTDKYHSGGLWSNTCCGHPRPGEDLKSAAERRLFEEMGIRVKLKEEFVFNYKIQFDESLWENEVDHVFLGYVNNLKINLDKKEVEEYRWMKMENLAENIKRNPDKYTYWFRYIISNLKGQMSNPNLKCKIL